MEDFKSIVNANAGPPLSWCQGSNPGGRPAFAFCVHHPPVCIPPVPPPPTCMPLRCPPPHAPNLSCASPCQQGSLFVRRGSCTQWQPCSSGTASSTLCLCMDGGGGGGVECRWRGLIC